MTVPGCLVCLALAAATPPAPTSVASAALDAPIVAVTVFGDRARVTRAVRLARWPSTRFLLPRLPAGADPDSVRVEVRGERARLEWIDVHQAAPDEVAPAATSVVLDGLARVERDLARARQEAEFMRKLAGTRDDDDDDDSDDDTSIEALPAPTRLQPAAWERAVAVLDRERARLLARAREQEQVQARLEQSKRELEARGQALVKDEGLVVSALLRAPGAAELRLIYDVTGASWEPTYDVHLDPRSDQVTVSLWAAVQQTTGEDWPGVELTVSTAAPTTPVLPELPAWRIGERELFTPVTQVKDPPPAPRPPVPTAPKPTTSELRNKLQAQAPGATIPNVTESFDVDMVESMPAPAVGYGRIVGYVFDQSGNPLAGVMVRVNTGRRAYTGPEGHFALEAIPVGKYELQASAPKLSTVVQRELTVKSGENAEANLVMEVSSTAVEEVAVVERAPVVATTRGSARETFDTAHGPPPSVRTSASEARHQVALAPPSPAAADDGPDPMPAAGGHTLVFRALAPETVASESGNRRVPLARYQFGATTERHFYPAVASGAFVLAQLRSPAKSPLPAGPASVAVGADPGGQASLGLMLPGQAVRLPVGVDQSLRAVRRVTQKSHDKGLIFREQVTRYDVVTEISNPNPWPLRAVVHDQLPISSDRTVTIALLDSSTPPRRKPETGELTFSLQIPPGATRSVRFAYTLSRPRGHRLHQ